MIDKNSDPNALTEREKQILDYLDQGHSWRETCRDLRVSPNEISAAKKKQSGEYRPEEKASPNFENYSEMYRLFSNGKQPIDVAIALNVPVDYVSEQYVEYLKSKRMHKFLQLYERIGDRGARAVLLGLQSMVDDGYSDKPESLGRYLKYCQQTREEGMSLEEIRETSSRAREETRAARSELQDVNAEISKGRKTRDGIKKEIEEANKELARVNDAIMVQVKTHPAATAAEAARQVAEVVLNDRVEMIRLAQQVIYDSANNECTRWLLLPETRPAQINSLPEAEIQRRLNEIIAQVAIQYYDRLTGRIVDRALQSRRIRMY